MHHFLAAKIAGHAIPGKLAIWYWGVAVVILVSSWAEKIRGVLFTLIGVVMGMMANAITNGKLNFVTGIPHGPQLKAYIVIFVLLALSLVLGLSKHSFHRRARQMMDAPPEEK